MVEWSNRSASVAEREVLRDAISVRLVHQGQAAKSAAASRAFGLGQMASARAGAQDFSAGRDLEPLGHGLLRFNTFGTSHKIVLSKRARNIEKAHGWRKWLILPFNSPRLLLKWA
jgi:hypothetical protein